MNFTDFNAMVESNAASLRSSWRNYSLSSSALIAVIVFGGEHLDGKRPMMVFAILGVNLCYSSVRIVKWRSSKHYEKTCHLNLQTQQLGKIGPKHLLVRSVLSAP